MEIYLMIALIFIFMFLSVPIAVSLGFAGFVYILLVDLPIALVIQRMVYGMDNFILLAIPFFMLAGQLMNTGGITDRIFKFANALVGHITGGLGHVNVIASLIFSGMSGAAVSDVVGLGALEIKAMRDAGYDGPFSCSVTGASAIIGPIVPPSIPMVVYGVLAGVSIGKLFLGGIVPGILMSISLMVIVSILSHKRRYPVGQKTTMGEKLMSLRRGQALACIQLIGSDRKRVMDIQCIQNGRQHGPAPFG